KPVIPTDRGARYLAVAKTVIREYGKLAQFSGSDKEVSGELRLGIIPTIAPYLLPLFLTDFTQRYPKAKLIVEELKTESILRALEEDRLDAAILSTPVGKTTLTQRPLYYEPFQLYVAENHALSAKNNLKASDLDGAELWMLQDGHCFRNQVVQFCSIPTSGRRPGRVAFEAGSLETLRHLVKNSSGYTMLPALAADYLSAEEKKKHVRQFQAPMPAREVSLMYRRDQWRAALIDAVAESVERSLPDHISVAKPKNFMLLEAC
ncbi:MAG: hydrogen peroxide-inducible genes activator, partial [Proteobacteria bacterium]